MTPCRRVKLSADGKVGRCRSCGKVLAATAVVCSKTPGMEAGRYEEYCDEKCEKLKTANLIVSRSSSSASRVRGAWRKYGIVAGAR